MQEIWKPIDGYDGRYEISNYGRVKSYMLDKTNGKIIGGTDNHAGYRVVFLRENDGTPKGHFIHKLVAEAFVENPNNYKEVNHIDENKKNNRADNLEWCTRSYNINYGKRNDTVARKNTNHPARSTPVFSIDMDGNFSFYDSIGEAERETGIAHGNIARCLKGHTPRCGKRYWFYSITTPTHLANND